MFNGDPDDISNGNMRKNMDSGGIMRGSNSNGNLQNGLEIELESILQPQHNGDVIIGLERDLNMYRSGSAPPSVEGSLSAMGSLFGTPNFVQMDNGGSGTSGSHTDEEIRSHPEYLSYYYSHLNLNPRLPPPLLSKEDWRVAQRFQAMGVSSGGITDWRKKSLIDDGSSSSLFSMQPGLPVQSAEDQLMELRKATTIQNIPRNNSDQWLDRRSDGKFGGYGAGMGRRRRSFADIVQEGLDQPASSSGHPSHSTSRRFQKPIGFSNSHLTVIHNEAEPNGTLNPRAATSYVSGIQNLSSAVESTMSRNRTPGTGPVDNRVYLPENYVLGSNAVNGLSSSMPQLADVAASLTGLSLLENLPPNEGSDIQSQPQMGFAEQPDNDPFDMSNGYAKSLQQRLIDQIKAEKLVIPPNNYADGIMTGFGKPDFDGQVNFRRRTTSPNFQSKTNSYLCANLGGSNSYYQSDDPSGMIFYGHVPNGYSSNQKLNTMIDNHLSSGSTLNSPGNGRSLRGSSLADLPSPDRDPRYIQYLQKTSNYGTPFSGSPNNQFERRNIGTSHGHGDFHGFHKAHLEALAQQRQQYELPHLGKLGSLSHRYNGDLSFAGMSCEGSSLPYQNEQNLHYTSMLRSLVGGSTGGRFTSSLLEDLKNNKSRTYELSDIVDHVVECSMDQYGSRFIQQKLEIISEEEKAKIFQEIIPHARSLMIDVFGNYVIQKFFEHGTENQRKELACQLTGHVMSLALQMYGCRVIQKALEVVDVDRQSRIVAELDGAVMKCVRDQNGNHVIQKCIECVPHDRIQFIISAFFGQVVALSCHPYGCRVIQRVLENCGDPNAQATIMDEIMNSVCTLAQDQYGNYVIQHVLEHGKSHERSTIISKLTGQIVNMSQQKFASNVVEKCLTFGSSEERQLLVNEMLGSTDENEPLQAMMKDPFGNYVVQKVLETCNDHSRELILSRIKIHLNTLKRYTYGKHIVSRVEKLIAAAERQIKLSSSYSS